LKLSKRGVKLPRAIGHEILGVVEKAGPDAHEIQLGSRQIVYPWIGRGKCRRCEQGDDNLCLALKSIGVASNGGFASHIIVPHSKFLVDPGDVDPAVACTFACSGITVLSSIRKVLPLEPDDPILLIGAGGLGLAAIATLRALGHQRRISADIAPEKRDAAIKTGATTAIDSSSEDAAKKIRDAAGAPVLGTIDFVGSTQTAALTFEVLAKGGKMVQVGIMGGELNLSLVGLILKALTMIGNHTGNPGRLREVAQLAKEGKLLQIPVTTLPVDDANSALARIREGKVAGRLVLTW
jgi:propanol-preferring alcohol dehydrogenase